MSKDDLAAVKVRAVTAARMRQEVAMDASRKAALVEAMRSAMVDLLQVADQGDKNPDAAFAQGVVEGLLTAASVLGIELTEAEKARAGL